MRRVFSHGGLRLFLLMLLDEQPQHGYDLIKMVEDRLLGMYTPSAGTVYPRLQSLEDEGLVEHEEIDGRKVYRLTDAGRRELHERRSELEELQRRAVESARNLAGAIRDEVRDSVREMRDDLRHAMKDARREERWAARQARTAAEDAFRGPRHHKARHRPPGPEPDAAGSRLELRALQGDLEAFVDDVLAAAQGLTVDRAALSRAREALLDARDLLVDALSGPEPSAAGQAVPDPADRPAPDGPADGEEHWA